MNLSSKSLLVVGRNRTLEFMMEDNRFEQSLVLSAITR